MPTILHYLLAKRNYDTYYFSKETSDEHWLCGFQKDVVVVLELDLVNIEDQKFSFEKLGGFLKANRRNS